MAGRACTAGAGTRGREPARSRTQQSIGGRRRVEPPRVLKCVRLHRAAHDGEQSICNRSGWERLGARTIMNTTINRLAETRRAAARLEARTAEARASPERARWRAEHVQPERVREAGSLHDREHNNQSADGDAQSRRAS